jgi:hypothetical protein
MGAMPSGLRILGLGLPIAACAASPSFDEDEALARAAAYRDELVRIVETPTAPTAHSAAGEQAWVWATPDTGERILALDPNADNADVSFPVETVIVKEVADAAGDPVLLFLLAKMPAGYDEERDDWFFGTLALDGTPELRDRGDTIFCHDCHAFGDGVADGAVIPPP